MTTIVNTCTDSKYGNLSCEFCKGEGQYSRDSDGMAIEGQCSFCEGTGLDLEWITEALGEGYTRKHLAKMAGLSLYKFNKLTK